MGGLSHRSSLLFSLAFSLVLSLYLFVSLAFSLFLSLVLFLFISLSRSLFPSPFLSCTFCTSSISPLGNERQQARASKPPARSLMSAERKKGFVRHANPLRSFNFQAIIGKGSYGKVYRAAAKDGGRLVAFKVLSLDDDEESITLEIQRELDSLRECQHPNIVQYEGAYIASKRLWVAMEYCLCSLHCVLSRTNRPLQEGQIAAVMARALRGLDYLHSQRHLIHRDVKAGNILLTSDGEVKLADFGVSAQLGGTLTKRNTVIGTPMYMSPEMIEEGQYDHRTDLWSLGITAIELAQMRPPLAEVKPAVRVLFLIPSRPAPELEKPDRWSANFNSFISALLVKDPAYRPDAAAALRHPFAKQGDESDTQMELVDAFLNVSRMGVEDKNHAIAGQPTLRSYQHRGNAPSILNVDANEATLPCSCRSSDDLLGQGTLGLASGPVVEHDTLGGRAPGPLNRALFSFMLDYEDYSPEDANCTSGDLQTLDRAFSATLFDDKCGNGYATLPTKTKEIAGT